MKTLILSIFLLLSGCVSYHASVNCGGSSEASRPLLNAAESAVDRVGRCI